MGGPWIDPTNAAKKLVYAEIQVDGPRAAEAVGAVASAAVGCRFEATSPVDDEAALMMLLETAFAPIAVYALVGEVPSKATQAAGVLIVAALAALSAASAASVAVDGGVWA